MRIYFYVNSGKGVTPEQGVGSGSRCQDYQLTSADRRAGQGDGAESGTAVREVSTEGDAGDAAMRKAGETRLLYNYLRDFSSSFGDQVPSRLGQGQEVLGRWVLELLKVVQQLQQR